MWLLAALIVLAPPPINATPVHGWRATLRRKIIRCGIGTEMRWPRLFGQFFRFDEWSLCRG
jgi:hypothetical protein